MRTPLTKAKAQQLLSARTRSGLSQYELAAKLGWVRSKIKRIERAEVSSIVADDLRRLESAIGLDPTPSAEENEDVVVLLGEVRPATPHQMFVRARVMVSTPPHELLGYQVHEAGHTRAVHGVEHATTQDPLKPGDEVVLMLWSG